MQQRSTFLNGRCNCEAGSAVLIKKLQESLEDVTDQLQIANKKNEEMRKLVEIVTEDKNYYQAELQKTESQKVQIQNQMMRMKKEYDSKSLLVNQLKKANRQLLDEIETLKQNIDETKFLFEAQQQQIERIRKEKNLIETQWNKVMKQVGTKMSMLQRKQQIEEKENQQLLANLPLKDRVRKVIKKIDREILQDETKKLNFSKRLQHEELWTTKESPISSTSSNKSICDQFYS